MTGTASAGARFSALQYRNFRLVWTGQIVSNVGTWMQNVATGWLVLQLKNSPLWLGLLGLSFALPMIALPLVGGAVVDRVDRVRLLFFTQTCQMLNALALALATWLGLVTVWHILAASFIGATLLAFDNPARNALIPDLVPRRDLMNALSLNGAIFTGAALVGPALAGALLVPLGAAWLFFMNGVSFLAMIGSLLFLRDVPANGGAERKSFAASMFAGIAYGWNNHFLRVLFVLFAFSAVFGRSYQGLLPIFARDIWHGGPKGYGFLLSSSGAGALVGAFGLASLRELRRRERLLIASGLIFSLSLILFAVSPTLFQGSLFLFVAGVSTTVFGTLVATYIQVETPNELRGRVMSLYTVCIIGLPALGALSSGAVAELLGGISGAPRAVLIGAILMGATLAAFAPFILRGGGDG